ncbi:MAG: biotin--[acetyl-CoA-carboxylase] ligase [Cyclobacteriaceae bacterium]|nr:biotin--[acetyl-CoA-carboxylase] ligase [Cyclobacteriaceae bacterium]
MHKIFAKTLFLGKIVHSLPHCHSTNEEAQNLLADHKTLEGEVVITANQTKGKGQRGNSWESEAGKNLHYSIILKPGFIKVSDQFSLHIISSLAIYDALFNNLGNKLTIKWPNDIYYLDKKLAGILIENSVRSYSMENTVIGIGLNVNQLTFKSPNATSLREICMQKFDINDLAEDILLNLERRYLQIKNGLTKQLYQEYSMRLYKLNSAHFFKDNLESFRGEIVGVNQMGQLLIQVNDEIRQYAFQEIEFVQDA